jgi:integrase
MVEVFRRPGTPYWYADLADPAVGRRRVSTKRTNKAEAREVARAWQEALDKHPVLKRSGLSFLEAAARYMEEADLSDTTLRGHISMSKKISESSLGDFDMGSLTHAQIKQFINERRQEFVVPHNKPDAVSDKRVSDETLRRFLALISAVHRHAINHGYFEGANPLATFDRSILKKTKPRDRQLRESQVQKVIAALEPEPQRIVIVLALTGMRSKELRTLRWSQVDLKKQVIHIGGLEEERTKTNRSRVVPINPAVVKALKEQRAEIYGGPNSPVFPSPRRDANGKRTFFRYSLSSIAKSGKEKLKGYTNHRLRHSFASWLLEKDVDPITIRDTLGHTTLSTTTIYSRRLSDSTAKRVRDTKLPALKTSK